MGCVQSSPKKDGESDSITINNNKWYLSSEIGSGSFGWVRKADCYTYTYKQYYLL